MPVEEVAEMIQAMENGYMLAEILEPGSYRPGTVARNVITLQRMWEASLPPKSE